jgi:hypothetical protein
MQKISLQEVKLTTDKRLQEYMMAEIYRGEDAEVIWWTTSSRSNEFQQNLSKKKIQHVVVECQWSERKENNQKCHGRQLS